MCKEYRSAKQLTLLRLKEVLEIIPVSKSSWYRGVNAGIYPAPVQLSKRTVAWRETEIISLIENFGKRP